MLILCGFKICQGHIGKVFDVHLRLSGEGMASSKGVVAAVLIVRRLLRRRALQAGVETPGQAALCAHPHTCPDNPHNCKLHSRKIFQTRFCFFCTFFTSTWTLAMIRGCDIDSSDFHMHCWLSLMITFHCDVLQTILPCIDLITYVYSHTFLGKHCFCFTFSLLSFVIAKDSVIVEI